MIKTCLEQSYFHDYKDGIVLKFVENIFWTALRFRERKLNFFKLKLKFRKGFFKKKPGNLPSFGHQVFWRPFFQSGCGKISPKDTHSFFGFNTKKKNKKGTFLKMAETPDMTLDILLDTSINYVLPRLLSTVSGRLTFRENVFLFFLFFILLGNE